MMVPIHIRIGKGKNGFKVDGSRVRNLHPLVEVYQGTAKEIPTVAFKVNVTLPQNAFDATTMELVMNLDELQVAADLEVEG